MDYERQSVQYYDGRNPAGGHQPNYCVSTSSCALNRKEAARRSVFILHFHNIGDVRSKAVLKFAVKLREMCVDVSLDLFEYDTPPKNWSAWYEQKLRQSDIV